ncbi:MAG: ferrous iron transporter B [Planctomycetes bacterium]|nr:ferrous iron transporter B [Planctomycetota bacterium]
MACRNQDTSGNDTAAPPTIALVGNPNVGKSIIFSLLTGRYVVVSNYPGTTVEVSSGAARVAGERVEVVDTPGVNSLIPRSEDEEVARAILLDRRPRAVMQVLDAKNLRRGLLITTQLAEMGMPALLALNMWDEAMDRGIDIDGDRLARALGVPVVKTVATQKKGIGKLASSVADAAAPTVRIDYGPAIEEAIAKLEPLLPELPLDKRAMALMLLAGDPGLEERVESEIQDQRAGTESTPIAPHRQGRGRRRRWRGGRDADTGREDPTRHGPGHYTRDAIGAVCSELQSKFSEPVSYVISKKRAAHVDGIVADVMTMHRPSESTRLSRAAFFYLVAPVLSLIVCYLSASILVGIMNKFYGLGANAGAVTWWLAALGAVCYLVAVFRWEKHANSISALVSRIVMHPVLAFPVLAAALWIVYKLVGEFGAGQCVDFIENRIFGNTIEPAEGFGLVDLNMFFPGIYYYLAEIADEFGLLGPKIPFAGINYYLAQLADLVVSRDDLIYQLLLDEQAGLISIAITYSFAIVLPVVGFFFFAFALMEDSGYLPRLAVMVDWLFKKIGLNGKAVLPMVLGLGCGAMATLTTRILGSRRERVIATFLLALAIPCSAQLGIISLVLADIGGGGAFAIYVFVIISQFLLVGYLASKVLKGRKAEFLLEVPPMRMPRLKNVVVKTLFRITWFMKEAVPLFMLGTLALFILTRVGYNEETRPMGLLTYVERLGAPITTHWLGLPDSLEAKHDHAVAGTESDNQIQPQTDGGRRSTMEAFIMGFLRRDYATLSIRTNFKSGFYSSRQALVALVVITLFVPCLASLFVIVKERGAATAAIIVCFIVPYAFFVGGVLDKLLRLMNFGS